MIEGDRRKMTSAKLSPDGSSAGVGSSFLLDYESGSQNDQIGNALRKAEELMEEQLGRLKMRSKEMVSRLTPRENVKEVYNLNNSAQPANEDANRLLNRPLVRLDTLQKELSALKGKAHDNASRSTSRLFSRVSLSPPRISLSRSASPMTSTHQRSKSPRPEEMRHIFPKEDASRPSSPPGLRDLIGKSDLPGVLRPAGTSRRQRSAVNFIPDRSPPDSPTCAHDVKYYNDGGIECHTSQNEGFRNRLDGLLPTKDFDLNQYVRLTTRNKELDFRMRELDACVSEKSPDKFFESATHRTHQFIQSDLKIQEELIQATKYASDLERKLMALERKARALEFDLNREKGLHDETDKALKEVVHSRLIDQAKLEALQAEQRELGRSLREAQQALVEKDRLLSDAKNKLHDVQTHYHVAQQKVKVMTRKEIEWGVQEAKLRHALRTITTELDGHTSDKNDEIRRARQHARHALETTTAASYAVTEGLVEAPLVDMSEFEWRLSRFENRHERVMSILENAHTHTHTHTAFLDSASHQKRLEEERSAKDEEREGGGARVRLLERRLAEARRETERVKERWRENERVNPSSGSAEWFS